MSNHPAKLLLSPFFIESPSMLTQHFHLSFQSSRKELATDIEAIKKKIAGTE